MVSLQNDLDRVVDQLHAATASQQSLQEQLDVIRSDRDSLLEELRHSAIGLLSNRFCYLLFLCLCLAKIKGQVQELSDRHSPL